MYLAVSTLHSLRGQCVEPIQSKPWKGTLDVSQACPKILERYDELWFGVLTNEQISGGFCRRRLAEIRMIEFPTPNLCLY